MAKLRIPVITFKDGLADAVKQRLLASDSPARALFQAGGLEFVAVPLPSFPPSHGVEATAPGDKVDADKAVLVLSTSLVESKWELTKDQEEVLAHATVVLGDAHNCAPLLLTPETGLPPNKQHLLKNVLWVQGTYAGVEQYLKRREADTPPPPFQLTHAGGINGLAQYVFGYVSIWSILCRSAFTTNCAAAGS
ncbi:hypothetical protein DVH05_014107 [Phytophthora capsici]|nr:hypothetical protein DVH05_014107 [Phytophthora capsici]